MRLHHHFLNCRTEFIYFDCKLLPDSAQTLLQHIRVNVGKKEIESRNELLISSSSAR